VSDPREQLQAKLGDRYAVQRELGRGGMATVYLAGADSIRSYGLPHDRLRTVLRKYNRLAEK
jgi:hypothetical protein